MATLNRILKSPHRKLRCRRLTVVHHQPPKTGPQSLSPEVQMLFNIHNPSQDHRDRIACGAVAVIEAGIMDIEWCLVIGEMFLWAAIVADGDEKR